MTTLCRAATLWALVGLLACNKHATPYDLATDAVGDPVFFEREQTARWLLVYDTLRLMVQDASSEDAAILCYVASDAWQCVEGRHGPSGTFLAERTWALSEAGPAAVKAVHGPELTALGHSVRQAADALGEGWATYPRQVEDAVEVWALPGSEPGAGPVVGETRLFRYTVDGRTLMEEEHWGRATQSIPANLDLDLTLASGERAHPSVGELFFSMYHRDAFRSITIETQQYRVSLLDADGVLGWSRAAR